MADLYRGDAPDPQDITRFEWETILRYMGASPEEIADVQLRMGRVLAVNTRPLRRSRGQL